jgi:hypothetical protein
MNPSVVPLSEATDILKKETGYNWTDRQLLQMLYEHGVSLQAITPKSTMVQLFLWQKDGRRMLHSATPTRHRAEVSGDNILELADRGEILVFWPVWTDEDLESAKLASLNSEHDIFLGDLMHFCVEMPPEFEILMAKNADCWTQDEERFQVTTHLEFAEPIRVTPSMVLVPSSAVLEIIRITNVTQYQGPNCTVTNSETIPAKLHAATYEKARPNKTWDVHSLRKLWHESREPGITQKKLGEQYGISRQAIKKHLLEAQSRFERKKASPFDIVKGGGRKR